MFWELFILETEEILLTFYNEITVLMEKRRATDVIPLDLCKVLDAVSHDILVCKFERHGFNR